MKIKNISNQHIKIKMDDGKVYDFPPGKIRSIRKELAEAILSRGKEIFKKVETNE